MSTPQARRLSPLTPVVRGFLLLAAFAFTTWDDLLDGRMGPTALALLGALLLGAVVGWASWLRTTYWVEGDELRIDTGVISRQSRRIRVDRLQAIDIVQPLVARLFGLAELRMDTAGGSREGSLAFLTLAEAARLRETLLARRGLAVARAVAGEDGTDAADGATPGHEGPPGWAPPDHDLAVLGLRTLLLSALLSPGTVVAVLVAVAAGVSFGLVGMAVTAPTLPVVLGFLLVQGRRLSAYYGFTVAQTGAGLQIRRGLFERSTQTLALPRVQGVLVSEPLMWRRLGWARLDVSVAGYGSGSDAEGPSLTTVMPVAPRALVMTLARTLLDGRGGLDPDAVATTAPPASARWRLPVLHRFLAAGVGEDLVVARGGWLTRRTHVVRHARVQSLRLTQGPWQRRLGLADVRLDSPPGPVAVRLRLRDAGEARHLVDLAVERGRRARGRA